MLCEMIMILSRVLESKARPPSTEHKDVKRYILLFHREVRARYLHLALKIKCYYTHTL